MVHKDLAPKNIVVGPSGAKLCDFGTARDGTETRLQTPGPGTPVYLPAEVIGDGQVNPFPFAAEPATADQPGKQARYGSSIDMFSFGLILQACIIGRCACVCVC